MTQKPLIVSGNGNRALANEIAHLLGTTLLQADVGSFDDGEVMIRNVDHVRDRNVFIFNPTCQPERNRSELELLARAIIPSAGKHGFVTAVMPYTGYARQDRKDEPRTPISIVQVLRDIISTGIDGLTMLDLHSGQLVGVCEALNPKLRVDHLYFRSVILDHLSRLDLTNVIISSTDAGGAKRVESLFKRLNRMGNPVEFGLGYKIGTSSTGIEEIRLLGDFGGRHAIFYDDMVTTAKTACQVARKAKEIGATKVTMLLVHPVLANDRVCELIAESDIDVFVTANSIAIKPEHRQILAPKLVELSCGPLMALAIKHLHEGQSVSALFELEGYRAGLRELEPST